MKKEGMRGKDKNIKRDEGEREKNEIKLFILKLLSSEDTAISRCTFASKENKLADTLTGDKLESVVRGVVNLQDLTVADAGAHERSGDVNKETETSETAATLQDTTDGRGQGDGLLSDTKARLTGQESVGLTFFQNNLCCQFLEEKRKRKIEK